ncbi:unnamed protein product [Pleuronectes platessa]|uniref:Uncharacterized protein n=1 Tax=Pleuronectes platessa TaxID=8262 RepID=A0A9N7TXK8_PLEPL|nr:unnamed protein product [Pleuronectes platessa]
MYMSRVHEPGARLPTHVTRRVVVLVPSGLIDTRRWCMTAKEKDSKISTWSMTFPVHQHSSSRKHSSSEAAGKISFDERQPPLHHLEQRGNTLQHVAQSCVVVLWLQRGNTLQHVAQSCVVVLWLQRGNTLQHVAQSCVVVLSLQRGNPLQHVAQSCVVVLWLQRGNTLQHVAQSWALMREVTGNLQKPS